MIHQPPTADGEALHSAVFSRLGVLNGLSSTPARLSGRKLHCAQHLAALMTNPGESCGLEGWGLVLFWRIGPRGYGRCAAWLDPHFSPVIYCDSKYAAISFVFLISLNQRTFGYASFVQPAKTTDLITSFDPRHENW